MRFQLNKEVETAIGNGGTLSASLRLSKFVKKGDGTKRKAEVDWVCGGHLDVPPFKLGDIPGVESLLMETKARLIINQSGGVLENANLALHRNFGCPYIPGSAVKGIARHAAWCAWDEIDEDEREVNAKLLSEIFGYPTGEERLDKELGGDYGEKEHGGKVAFLPAFPVSGVNLETDILNSHEGRSPIPVFFPAVAAGCIFQFAVKPLSLASVLEPEELTSFALDFLKDGLRHYGAGAKTAAGYGWFEEVKR